MTTAQLSSLFVMISERKAGNTVLIEGRKLHDVVIPIGERGLTISKLPWQHLGFQYSSD